MSHARNAFFERYWQLKQQKHQRPHYGRMIVDDAVIIENKTVDKIAPIHEAQLLTYLKLTNLNLGFLLNWNVPLMKDGIKRMVNRLKD
jgi:GxxExxY protein